MRKWMVLAAPLASAMALMFLLSSAHAYTDKALIDGFNKTVFRSEIAVPLLSQSYLRKFSGPVRMHVSSQTGTRRASDVKRFGLSLNRLIAGLSVRTVDNADAANFHVHVVKQQNFQSAVRKFVSGTFSRVVDGRCVVSSTFSRKGISKSVAVIVGDKGDDLFSRCMTEEILQGLGPLNDDRSLVHSMFNDTSRFTEFRRFDRLLLNMLYDKRLRPGMSKRQANRLLPRITRDVQRRISGR